MRSILPPSLLAAGLLSLLACESEEDPAAEGAAQQDGQVPAQQEIDASDAAAVASDDDADATDDAGSSPQDAAQGGDTDAAAPSQPPDAGAPKPTFDELMQVYSAWSAQPSEPQAISTQIASLCRIPSAAENAFVASEHGDYRYLQNWLNPAAKRSFDDKRTPFELGAAIVKEKLVLEAAGKYRLIARGLMIKRAPGFDPAHGDWEFGYWEPGKELQSGDQTARSCGGCHASAGTDFVFLDGRWRFPL